MRRIAVLALAAALGLTAAGCGSGDDESSAPATTAGGGTGQTVQIGETEYMLDPSSPTVANAGTVTFHVVNNGSSGHALEIEGNGIEEETNELGAGESADLAVDLKPGTYEIYCPISDHRSKGMEGTLVVGGGGSGGTTTGGDDDNGGGTTTGDDDDDDGGGYGY